MSRTRFRVNPHSIVALMSRNSLLETGAKSEVYVTATQLNHLASLAKWFGCGFESSCSHLNFRFRACFDQGVPDVKLHHVA